MSARILTPAELADLLSALGLQVPAGVGAALVPLSVPVGMAQARGALTPKRPSRRQLPACIALSVLGMVRGPEVSTVIFAAWRRA